MRYDEKKTNELIIRRLIELKLLVPEQRFGQILGNAGINFYTPDAQALDMLEDYKAQMIAYKEGEENK